MLRAGAGTRVLIKDTDLVSTVVYARHYYGSCPAWIERAARERLGDLYLLLHPDVPWVADGLQRDRPATRGELHRLFAEALAALGAPVVDITGGWPARLARAVAAIEQERGHVRSDPLAESGAVTGALDAELLQPEVERARVQAEPLRRAARSFDLPVARRADAEDMRPLRLLQCPVGAGGVVRAARAGSAGRPARGRAQLITQREHGPPREDHRPLDDVFELPHVAGPVGTG